MAGGPAPLPPAQAVQSWTSGAKDLVMTALGSSRVWATTGQGIFTEIYWPAVDQPQVKDLGFLIGGTGWWQEVKRAGHYTLSTPEPGLMLPTIVHAGRNQAYQLTLRPVVDPDHDALLIEYELAGEGVRLYPLLAPHLGIGQITPEPQWAALGADNLGVDRPGGPGHVRQRQQRLPVPARPARLHPRRSRLRGRYGRLDRLQPPPVDDPDLRSGRARGRRPDRGAGGGLRAARPGVRRPPGRGPGRGAGEPGRRLRRDGGGVRPGLAGLDGGPHPARAGPAGGGGVSRRRPGLADALRESAVVLRTHADHTVSGAYVAGLAIPWGNYGNDPGGYHMVWCRDGGETALALAAAGHTDDAATALGYLAGRQRQDGSWPRCFFVSRVPGRLRSAGGGAAG